MNRRQPGVGQRGRAAGAVGQRQYLDARGYKVFAIGFPHKTGDGYRWSEQIRDAIQLIRTKTGASQVDLVGWSKGAFNARMYVSSLRQSWGRHSVPRSRF